MKKILFFLLLWCNLVNAQNEIKLAQTALSLKESIGTFEELKRAGQREDIARASYQIGNIYEKEQFGAKATEYYQIALENTDNLDFQKEIYKGIIHAHSLENELDSVLLFSNLLLKLAIKKKDADTQLTTLQTIAKIQEQQKKYPEAFATYERILKVSEDRPANYVTALNNIACLHAKNADANEAIKVFSKVEEVDQEAGVLDKVKLFSNMGIAYTNAENMPRALYYFNKANAAATTQRQKAEISHLISSTYLAEKDWYNAQQYNNAAMQIARSVNYPELLSESYATAAETHQGLYEYEDALNFFEKHLKIKDSLLLEERLRRQTLLQQQFLLEKAEKEIKLLLVNEEISNLTIGRLELEKNNLKLASDKLALETAQQDASIALLQKEKAIREADLRNQELAALQAKQQLKLTKQQLEAEQKDRNIAELRQKEELQAMKLAEQTAIEKERLQEIELLNQQQSINNLQLEKQETFRQGAYVAGGLLSLVLALMAASYFLARRSNIKLAAQKKQLERSQAETETEKAKSDSLLLNILPAATAEELKEKGVATPRHYDQVSVLFTDFVNFTQFAEGTSAEDLIEELNTCFIAFDEIIERHNLEKIKTIGDAYMCAGGIPVANRTNAIDAVKAGLEMQTFIKKRRIANQKSGRLHCEMRVGIHTGAVVAGVVGKNKFAYDIWGDTVNLASRMESSAEIGTVNISDSTHKLLDEAFTCDYRGEIEVKNKGKVRMYRVKG